ncbi:hypothetical protein O7635_05135 [Asanoa sp. WMMD1127]|nr:hypothetical protein [Asanoa sp. WMMD1127]MDG4821237.1 hypothetical protein [Asanoa sp. WMMD1127]
MVAGGVASADAYVDRAEVSGVGSVVSNVASESAFTAFSYDWG